MGGSSHSGRVGGLAVALGVGAAALTGLAPPALADPADSSPAAEASAESSADSASRTTEPTGDPASDQPAEDAMPTTTSVSSGATATQARPGVVVGTGGARRTAAEDEDVQATDLLAPGTKSPIVEPDDPPESAVPAPNTVAESAPEFVSQPSASEPERSAGSARQAAAPAEAARSAPEPGAAGPPDSKVDATAVEVDVELVPRDAAPLKTAPVGPVAAAPPRSASPVPSAALPAPPPQPPTVPSLRPWPTAFDPTTVVRYVSDLASSLVSAVLSPFAAGPPPPPTDPSSWALLAWLRREFFNETPTITYNPLQNTQALNSDGDVVVTGSIGAFDADGDPLRYTVIGRPLNGGTVAVDEHGNFTYRPSNAMAAVGGTDTFTVVVDDEAAGVHVHGLAGLTQFVPILGNFINPGGGHRVASAITVTVTPVEGIDLSFPDGFRWGVAHSGFQAEGGPGSPVDPNSDWYRWTHDPFNRFLGLTNGIPENGPGAYVRYDDDARLARDELGMNTFRMSIEWSRIFPESTASVDISDEGGTVSLADLQALDALADQGEVAHYRAVFDSLRAHGLEPVVTLNHFTLPVWVHDPITTRLLVQFGLPAPKAGWLSPGTPDEFEKYAAYVAWKYGDQVDTWVTLNEPFPPIITQYLGIPIPGSPIPYWPPGVIRPDLATTFLVNQAKGHVAAYDAIHRWDTCVAAGSSCVSSGDQPAAFVGFSHNMIPARPANPVNPLDVQAAAAWNSYYNHWFPNAVIDGWVDANFDGRRTADEIHPDFVGKVDFLGVQYYGSQPMQGIGFAPVPGFPFLQGLPIQCSADSPTCSDFNQPTDPGGFREVLEVAAAYGKPLWITENGIADAHDSKRPSYLVNHIAVVQDLVAHGMDIRGYTYWSFVDNLEWAHGYDLQFGLYGSDPATPELERTPKPASISAISSITTSHALPADLLASYLPGAPAATGAV